MANGTPPGHTIRSASDETAAKTESAKAHTILSASKEGTTKPDGHAARQPHDQAARPFNGYTAQAGRGVARAAMDQPARQFGAGGEAISHATQDLARTMRFGSVLASSYGAVCSEMIKHMHQAAQRQSEMLNDMLRARSPTDLLLTGNRYFLGGVQAFFDTSARIAQASAQTADDADRKRIRRAA